MLAVLIQTLYRVRYLVRRTFIAVKEALHLYHMPHMYLRS
jgi:hypothetical protein